MGWLIIAITSSPSRQPSELRSVIDRLAFRGSSARLSRVKSSIQKGSPSPSVHLDHHRCGFRGSVHRSDSLLAFCQNSRPVPGSRMRSLLMCVSVSEMFPATRRQSRK